MEPQKRSESITSWLGSVNGRKGLSALKPQTVTMAICPSAATPRAIQKGRVYNGNLVSTVKKRHDEKDDDEDGWDYSSGEKGVEAPDPDEGVEACKVPFWKGNLRQGSGVVLYAYFDGE